MEKILEVLLDSRNISDIVTILGIYDVETQQEQIEVMAYLIKTIKEQRILINKLKKENSKISASKGGYVKENNKLRAKLDAKDRVIEEYQKALYQAEEKNQNQLNTIKELTKKIDHKSIEYKNNGLPKQSKKAFKKGNK